MEFLQADRGLAFRMTDGSGRVLSGIMRLHRNTGDALTSSKLKALLRGAEFNGEDAP